MEDKFGDASRKDEDPKITEISFEQARPQNMDVDESNQNGFEVTFRPTALCRIPFHRTVTFDLFPLGGRFSNDSPSEKARLLNFYHLCRIALDEN